jgi:Zn-finger nucleic acid-binding protein
MLSDMSYRDRPLRCPRCGIELSRIDGRDRWRCAKCQGALFAVVEVICELVAAAPDLVPDAGIGGLTTLGRRSAAPLLACAQCGAPMEPVFLGGVDVDRCYHDEVLWFDRNELRWVVETAHEQHRERARSWLARIFEP